MNTVEFFSYKRGDFVTYEKLVEKKKKFSAKVQKCTIDRDFLQDKLNLLKQSETPVVTVYDCMVALDAAEKEMNRYVRKLEEINKQLEEFTK